MQKLTERGIRLASVFKDQGYKVIESYPGAAQDISVLPGKKTNLRKLKADLMDIGIKLLSSRKVLTHDEIDAIIFALVGYLYLAGMYEAIGNVEEGYLILPDLKDYKP